MMKFAILYWFYTDPEVSANHLKIIRRYNPDTPIYGLFGGEKSEQYLYQDMLGEYLDDFYCFTKDWNSKQKWFYGDLMISSWFRERGYQFEWDTLFIAQWDMLVFAPVERLFPTLKSGQLLLSGLRKVQEVEAWWDWTCHDYPQQRRLYDAFMAHVKSTYNYSMDPLCCLFVVACMPKEFLEKYVSIERPDLGFLEYKLPIYGQVFNFPFCTEHSYNPLWLKEPGSKDREKLQILNAAGVDVMESVVRENIADPEGARLFHPYRKVIVLDDG